MPFLGATPVLWSMNNSEHVALVVYVIWESGTFRTLDEAVEFCLLDAYNGHEEEHAEAEAQRYKMVGTTEGKQILLVLCDMSC